VGIEESIGSSEMVGNEGIVIGVMVGPTTKTAFFR
jgi:hypothetical protein